MPIVTSVSGHFSLGFNEAPANSPGNGTVVMAAIDRLAPELQ